MKKGDRVEFTIPSGKTIRGIYEGKTGERAIIKGVKKNYKPPLKLVKMSKAEAPKQTPVPNPKKAREEFIKRYKNYSESRLEEEIKRLKAMRPKGSSQNPDTPINKIALSELDKLLLKKVRPGYKYWWGYEKVDTPKPKPTIVEVKIGDKESMKKGVKKLTDTFLSKAERDIDVIHKEFTLAKARKELKKSKVDFVKFLDRSNEAGEKLNSIIETLNKGIKADTISSAESSSLGSKIKRHQTARKKIMGELQKAFDSKEDLEKTLKEAGIKTLKR